MGFGISHPSLERRDSNMKGSGSHLPAFVSKSIVKLVKISPLGDHQAGASFAANSPGTSCSSPSPECDTVSTQRNREHRSQHGRLCGNLLGRIGDPGQGQLVDGFHWPKVLIPRLLTRYYNLHLVAEGKKGRDGEGRTRRK